MKANNTCNYANKSKSIYEQIRISSKEYKSRLQILHVVCGVDDFNGDIPYEFVGGGLVDVVIAELLLEDFKNTDDDRDKLGGIKPE